MIKLFDQNWYVVSSTIVYLFAYAVISINIYLNTPKISLRKIFLINAITTVLIVFNAWAIVTLLSNVDMNTAILICIIITMLSIIGIFALMRHNTNRPKQHTFVYVVVLWVILINLSHLINYVCEEQESPKYGSVSIIL
jgi:thiol:disulfide interchange protein